MTDMHMKRWSVLLAIREIGIKVTMRYHLIPTGIVIQKKTTNIGEDVRKWEPSYMLVGMENSAATLENGSLLRSSTYTHHVIQQLNCCVI